MITGVSTTFSFSLSFPGKRFIKIGVFPQKILLSMNQTQVGIPDVLKVPQNMQFHPAIFF